ncbi:DNA-binding response regulator [Pseudomonas sp. o96-267]|uniref:response regulator n=1 Tax=Pseudomonas sp. o96-267 TaxID=2479853 RepID=UPI000F77EE19|nr:response regulator transcription factor [Pseudomonas sp. o96-267]RRV26245.1 DNA-binding response regulator [Pseudomonas sp. o96-267]
MTTRLLLIDDHTLFRSGIAMVLAAGLSRVEIFEAASLEEALRCPAETLDLLLLDIQLQGLNGLEGIAPLKRRWPEAKILMVSAFHEADAVRNALARGAQGFISKAETPDRMLSIIAAQLSCNATPAEPEALPEQIRLTPRQCEVLDLLCQGLSNKMIGRRLNLSENTVRGHVQAMLATLQVSSRSEAAFIARRMGLVS